MAIHFPSSVWIKQRSNFLKWSIISAGFVIPVSLEQLSVTALLLPGLLLRNPSVAEENHPGSHFWGENINRQSWWVSLQKPGLAPTKGVGMWGKESAEEFSWAPGFLRVKFWLSPQAHPCKVSITQGWSNRTEKEALTSPIRPQQFLGLQWKIHFQIFGDLP